MTYVWNFSLRITKGSSLYAFDSQCVPLHNTTPTGNVQCRWRKKQNKKLYNLDISSAKSPVAQLAPSSISNRDVQGSNSPFPIAVTNYQKAV